MNLVTLLSATSRELRFPFFPPLPFLLLVCSALCLHSRMDATVVQFASTDVECLGDSETSKNSKHQQPEPLSSEQLDASGSLTEGHPSAACEEGAPIPIGRTLESQRARQAVYIGPRTEGFSADEAPGDITVPQKLAAPLGTASGTSVQHLLSHNTHRNHFKDCEFSDIAKPPCAATHLENWSNCCGATAPMAAANLSPDNNVPLSPSVRGGKPMPVFKSALAASQSMGSSLTPLSLSALGAAGSSAAAAKSPGCLSLHSGVSPTTRSPLHRYNGAAPIPHDLSINCLDEKQTKTTRELWWRSSSDIPDDVLQDFPPDMFMEICYPQQGFYVRMKDQDCARFSWNERFQSIFNIGETTERRVGMQEFVRDFALEAVPFAMEVLANLTAIPSPVVHKNGITVEIPWLMPCVKYMFEDEGPEGLLRSMKTVNVEFCGRHFATMGACPQLNIPFTLMVEYIGVKALVYPRLPLQNGGFPLPRLHCSKGGGGQGGAAMEPGSLHLPSDVPCPPTNPELVYGMERPEWFHAEPLLQHDSEVNAVVQRLALLTRCKGCWLGREFSEKRYIHGPVDMKVFRSALDNRIYANGLARLCPSTTAGDLNDVAVDDQPDDLQALRASVPRRPNDQYLHRFRPEFVQRHQRLDLSSESTSIIAKINTEKDESERLQLVDMLLLYVVPQAAEQLARDVRLNGITWPFFARGGLSNFLHSWGINMRFLVLVHQKLIRTKMSGKALTFVEVEIVARSLKQWALSTSAECKSSGEIREYGVTDALSSCLVPFTEEFWKTVVWPAVERKYEYFQRKQVQKWDVSRVDHEKIIQRLLRMMGAVVMLHETDALCSRLDWIKSPADVQMVRIRFYPIVKCPSYPRAPLEEGQDVHLMILAKRYLREVTFDLKYNPVSNRDMLERYIAFLEQMGERHCEEIAGFYVAEQERKDRVLKGAKPASYAEAGKDERTIKYRLKGNRGMRVIEVAREALDRFKFYHNQKVQQTLGGDAGVISTIIGVIDGVLYHHEEGADGATEFFGRNFNEIQGNYGLVLLDKLLYLRRSQHSSGSGTVAPSAPHPNAASGASLFNSITPADVALKHPYHQVGDRGLLIFETLSEIMLDTFSTESGQRFMFVRGPRRGTVTTVIGLIDGSLWHHVDGATQYEVIRVPSSVSSDHCSDDASTSTAVQQQQRFAAFRSADAVTLGRSKLSYPIDPSVVYEESLDIFAGYRSCVPFGFFFRQLVYFQKGPFAEQRGVVLGALSGNLQCLLPFCHVPVSLGTTHAEIVAAHAPQVMGILSYDPIHEPPPEFVFYPGLGGDVMRFDVSYGTCLPLGGVRGQRIKVYLGHLAGLCGFVVGAQSGKLWAQLDGESGAQPLVQGAFLVIRGSLFVPDRSIEVPQDSVTEEQFLSVFPDRHPHATRMKRGRRDDEAPDIMVQFLAEFGEVVCFDASPVACDRFGFYHSQRLRMQRSPRMQLGDLTADVVYVVVVGVFHGELFYVVEGEPFARPFLARTRWHIEWMYAPDVVGLSAIANFSDMFCRDSSRLQLSGVDTFHEDPSVQLVYCVATDSVIGLDTLGVSKLHSSWRSGTTIIRQDRVVSETLANGSVVHRPDGPQAIVLGTFQQQLYIEFRSSYDISIGRANATSTLRRVEVLPLKECTKWLPCAGWQHQVRKTFLSPEEIKKSDSYESRIGLETVESPIFTYWWCYLMLDEEDGAAPRDAAKEHSLALDPTLGIVHPVPSLVLFSRELSLCLEKLYEVNGGKRGSHYDVDGGAYYIETMTYRIKDVLEDTEVVYDMVREPLETINSYALYQFRVDIKTFFPVIHEALLTRIAARIYGQPGMALRHVSFRRQTEVAFARDEIQVMHDVCEIIPIMVHSALERVGRSMPNNLIREVELRYASVPHALHLPMLRWVLTLLGVSCNAEASIESLYALLVAVEQSTGRVTDVPMIHEFDLHVREQMSAVVEHEVSMRLVLLQQERNEWLRRMPRTVHARILGSKNGRRANRDVGAAQHLSLGLEPPRPFDEMDAYDGMSIRVTKSCLSIANEKFAALMAHKTSHNVSCACRLPLVHRFTLQDGTGMLLSPSCMTFQRGDVVEYSLGDVQGTRATIVGMFGGHLWRYEHTGHYQGLVMPFAGTEEDIQARYGLRIVKRENQSHVRLSPAHKLKLKESNMVKFLCFDGLMRDLDVSHHAVSPFGVLAGDRYVTTHQTNLELFPFQSLVILVVGVCSHGMLWFTVDQTGAIPFKTLSESSTPHVNIVEHFRLHRAYHAPFRQPLFESSKLVACQGVIGPEEGAVCGSIGPMTLVFLTAAEALKQHHNINPGAKLALVSGDNKGRRFSVIGMRHAKLWVIWEYELAARPLKGGLSQYDFKVLNPDASGGFRSPEMTTQLNLAQTLCSSRPAGAWLRFPTQRGGLALFQTDCYETYKLESGQQVMYSVAKKGAASLPKKKATIVGIRDGGLWKVDAFESDAKPFIGVSDLATLQKKFEVTAGAMVGIESETW